PTTAMRGVYTGLPSVSALRFACDETRSGTNAVDFYYSNATQADNIYQMFRAAAGDPTFLGTSNRGAFQGRAFTDIVASTSGTTATGGADLRIEDGDSDTGDFLIGTNGMYSAGDSHCYGRGAQFVANC